MAVVSGYSIKVVVPALCNYVINSHDLVLKQQISSNGIENMVECCTHTYRFSKYMVSYKNA